MVKAIYQAAQNMQTKSKNIEIVANNLANISTVGFKRELPFTELLTRYKDSPFKQLTDFSEGNSVFSNNPLDLAIQGTGFFTVKGDDGREELTRDGRFSISIDGFLINASGAKVQGQKGDINLYEVLVDKNKSVIVTKDGEVRIGDDVVDQLLIQKIETQEHLVRTNAQAFFYEEGSSVPAEDGEYKIAQGYVEESNVSPVLEMQSMITLNKDFEATQKIIGFFDNSLGKASEVGKV